MTSFVVTVAMSAALVALCFFLHFAAMKRLAKIVHYRERPVRRPLLLVIFSLFGVHLVETLLYAVAFAIIEQQGLGFLSGAVGTGPEWFSDHFYFSIASYTTLASATSCPRARCAWWQGWNP